MKTAMETKARIMIFIYGCLFSESCMMGISWKDGSQKDTKTDTNAEVRVRTDILSERRLRWLEYMIRIL